MLKMGAVCATILCAWVGQTAAEPLKIHASHGVIADFARQIGGELVDVTMPVPRGTDPAQWVPGIPDITAMQAADLILLNGADYESWVDRVSLPRASTVQTAQRAGIDLITLPGVAHSHGDGPSHTHEGTASQVWLDLAAAARQAETIAAAMTRTAPAPTAAAADKLADGLTNLTTDLMALDDKARALGASLDGTTLLVAQPGLEYFARAYGLHLIEATIDPVQPPTPDQWAAIDATLAQTPARIMLWQTPPPATVAAALAERGVTTALFETGANPDPETSFTDLMRRNLTGLQSIHDTSTQKDNK